MVDESTNTNEEIISPVATPASVVEMSGQMEISTEPVIEPSQAPELQTAQMGGNEPFDSVAETKVGSEPTQILAESNSPQEQVSAPVFRNMMRELFAKAQTAIQVRKRKKLERIMASFEKKSSITNDEVEKLLHISDATATRYLEILKKENKIKQSGKTGKAVLYIKT